MSQSTDNSVVDRLNDTELARALSERMTAASEDGALLGWCIGLSTDVANPTDSAFSRLFSGVESHRFFGEGKTVFVRQFTRAGFRAALGHTIDRMLAKQDIGPEGTVLHFVVASEVKESLAQNALKLMADSAMGQESQTVVRLGSLTSDWAAQNLARADDSPVSLDLLLSEDRLASVDQGIFPAHAIEAEVFETLARFRDEDGSLMTATRVLSGLEGDAVLSRLDQAMLHRGLSRLEADPELRLTINVCRTSLLDDEWHDTLEIERSRTGEAFSRAILEITEWPARAAHTPLRSSARDVVALGMQIWLDDFGAGLTSFNEVFTPGITGLKVDRSMLRLSMDCDDCFGLISEVARFAKALDMVCVVEGAEDEDERAFAETKGATHVQGFFSGRI